MKELSPKARALLEAMQTVDSPTADIEARAWTAVTSRTAAGDLGPSVPAEPIGPSAAASSAWLGKPVLWIVGAVAIATGTALALGRDDAPVDPPTPIEVRTIDEVPPTPARAAIPVPPAPAPVVTPPPVETPAVVPAPVKRTRGKTEPVRPAKPTPPVEGPDALEQEMRLMSDARAALGAGDAARAITLLQSHAKQFPRGAFVLEREVSWITALCALGRTDAARTRADAFLQRHGSHALAAKVRASCGGTP